MARATVRPVTRRQLQRKKANNRHPGLERQWLETRIDPDRRADSRTSGSRGSGIETTSVRGAVFL